MDSKAEFFAFVDSHGDRLMRVAYLLEGSQVDAEDLLQDTLLRIYEHWRTVRRARHMSAYVRRILINQHLSRVRKRSVVREFLTDHPDSVPTVSPDLARVMAQRDELKEALLGLPGRQRTAIVLRFYEDLDDKAIGAIMNIAPSSVRSALSRGLQRLRLNATGQFDRSSHHAL